MIRDILIRTAAVLALIFLATRVGIRVAQEVWSDTWHAHSVFWLMQFMIALVVAGVAWTGGGAALWAPAPAAIGTAVAPKAEEEVRGGEGAVRPTHPRSYIPEHLSALQVESDALIRHSIDRICITVVVLFAAGQGLLLLAL
jgi:hypothetical protein